MHTRTQAYFRARKPHTILNSPSAVSSCTASGPRQPDRPWPSFSGTHTQWLRARRDLRTFDFNALAFSPDNLAVLVAEIFYQASVPARAPLLTITSQHDRTRPRSRPPAGGRVCCSAVGDAHFIAEALRLSVLWSALFYIMSVSPLVSGQSFIHRLYSSHHDFCLEFARFHIHCWDYDLVVILR
jgi:hypothetical protein